MWAFFCLRPILDCCVWASTRITVQCFFSSSKSVVMPWSPLLYFLTYLLNAFFLDLYLARGWCQQAVQSSMQQGSWQACHALLATMTRHSIGQLEPPVHDTDDGPAGLAPAN